MKSLARIVCPTAGHELCKHRGTGCRDGQMLGEGGGRYCSASDNNTTNKTRGSGGSIKIPTASQIYFRKQEGGLSIRTLYNYNTVYRIAGNFRGVKYSLFSWAS